MNLSNRASISVPSSTGARRLGVTASLLLAGVVGFACGDDPEGTASATGGSSGTATEGCVDGYEGCPCTPDGLCLGGLVCAEQGCVAPGGTGTASESDSGSISDSQGSGSSDATTASTGDVTASASDSDSATTDSDSATTDSDSATTDSDSATTDSGSDSATTDSDSGTTDSGTTGGTGDGTMTDGTGGTDSTGGVVCGDDIAEGDEACDGEDLGGASCVGLGYKGGKLSCTADCALSEEQCTNSLACGDGLIVPGLLCYKPAVSLGPAYYVWLVTGDFDEDDHVDVVGGHVQSGLRTWVGDGLGGLTPLPTEVIDVAPRVVVDLDHDGHLDIVGDRYGDKIGVAYGDGLGNFIMGETYDTFANVTTVGVGDVNDDGWDDVAVGNGGNVNKVSFRLGKPGGVFGPQVSYDAPKDAYMVGFADVDEDGKIDLWAFTGWGDFLLYKGNGAGSFALQPDQPKLPASAPRWATVAHFNGDSHYDIALFDNAAGNLHVRLGEAMGFSQMLYSYQVDDIFPFTGVAGNFDGNDDLDLAGFTNSGVLDVFRGDGTGLFYDGVNLEPGLYGRAVTAGDLNEDGIDDFITSHAYTNIKNVDFKVILSDP
ncbi:MAG: VCBS repeat-containing protein [Myxococcales bacterium]|nr:VCBS repeat-containing protein [Myxococcales bacterium]